MITARKEVLQFPVLKDPDTAGHREKLILLHIAFSYPSYPVGYTVSAFLPTAIHYTRLF